MVGLTKQLATSLGPGTESLRIRFGLNSGPTTAGVLRGDRSRFQLFGDTANTAARYVWDIMNWLNRHASVLSHLHS